MAGDDRISRRTFIAAAGAAAAAATLDDHAFAAPGRGAIPIIDTHIHLFDPGRPQGALKFRWARSGPRRLADMLWDGASIED